MRYLSANSAPNMRSNRPSRPRTAEPRRNGRRLRSRLTLLWWLSLAGAPGLLSQGGGLFQSVNGGPSGAVFASPDVVHGTVINAQTKEPIARALVFSPERRYAAITDDEGHFEFKFAPPEKPAPPIPSSGIDTQGMLKYQQWSGRNARPNIFFARRPGFLQDRNGAVVPQNVGERAEIVILLQPEALVVGHVQLPGVDNTDRVRMQLYRQEFEDGHEKWTPAGNFTTWSNGEFRFSELPAGTYKLFSLERMEQEAAIFNADDQRYGFPPVFFPNGRDFSGAAPIRLAAGATFQANLKVERRGYYPVKIEVANAPAGGYVSAEVFPRGHPGPGYTLSYDPGEQEVRGFLPDGGYTLQLASQGEAGMSGNLSFTVHGEPVEGILASLHPNVSLSVNITREFGSAGAEGEALTREGNAGINDAQASTTIRLDPVENFGMGMTVISQPVPGSTEGELRLNNVPAGVYWMQITTQDAYPASATWSGGDVLHKPLTVGMEGGDTPIEVTLRNDGAEVLGKLQIPGSESAQKPNDGTAIGGSMPVGVIYFVPVGEHGGQIQESEIWQDGAFDQKQLAPGTYRILALGQRNEEITAGNPEVLKKYESTSVVVELSASQTLRLPTPLPVVSAQ